MNFKVILQVWSNTIKQKPNQVFPSELLPTKMHITAICNNFAYEEHANSFLWIKDYNMFVSEFVTNIDPFL